jgi:hypothetical protein
MAGDQVDMENATFTGDITVDAGADLLLTNMTFTGTARQVIFMTGNVTVATGGGNGLTATSGSTIDGSGTLTCGGAGQSLPLTLNGGSACEN